MSMAMIKALHRLVAGPKLNVVPVLFKDARNCDHQKRGRMDTLIRTHYDYGKKVALYLLELKKQHVSTAGSEKK